MTLNPKLAEWLTGRAIDPETAVRMGIYSGRRGPAGDVVPDAVGDVLVFPYIEAGREVGAKYRARGKRFWQREGGRKTFFNADVLDDPALISGDYPLVICEGEMDALAFIQAGYPFVVSVPNGGTPAKDAEGNPKVVPETADDVDPKQDDAFKYVVNNWPRLQRVKRIVLATDGDEVGWYLAQELARRLQRSRCCFVSFPEGCKDSNDVLVSHGPRAVVELVTHAKPFPVRGLYKLSDFPDEAPIKTFSTGFQELDWNPERPKEPHLLLYRGAFVVVSGIPGCGKTQWTTQLAYNAAALHGWRVGIASFEMRVSPTLRDMLRGFYLRRPRSSWGRDGTQEADRFIQERFSFIALAPHDDETEADINWVIDRAADAVVRDGIDMLVIDPWNEVEHRRRGGESVADYTNRAIRSLKRFAHSYDVCTLVVAHPTKAAGLAVKNGEAVSLYDISDGATWANKAEQGVIISRKSQHDLITEVGIRKIKFRGTGRIGEVYMSFDESMEAFV